MSEKNNREDNLVKYKRLLSLARSNLEANQASLAEKDKQIQTLRTTLDDIHKSGAMRSLNRGKEDEIIPKRLTHRVNTSDAIWILAEYNIGKKWLQFSTEDDLDDFVKRADGSRLRG